MPVNLFALIDEPGGRIRRFSLSSTIQSDIGQHFQNLKLDFESACQTEIPFDGKYKPDYGEMLVIQPFDDINGLQAAVQSPLSIPQIDPTPEAFKSIKAIFTSLPDGNGGVAILIQQFDKRKIISTNGISIFHSGGTYKKVEDVGITIDEKLSAVMSGDTLRFFSFHTTRQIFDLSGHYKEATDNDIIEFSNLDVISVGDVQKLIGMSDTWVRRKVSLIQQSQILELVPMTKIKAVALEFGISLNTEQVDGGKEVIVLPESKAELKNILRFLDEDYYKSPLSDTPHVTNSKRLLVTTVAA